jgi:hypothetical protein
MDTDFWKRQWDTFLAAPVPTLFFFAFGLMIAWWFRGRTDDGEIRGLKAQIGAMEERLRLATDRAQQLTDVKRQLEDDFRELRAQIDAGAPTQLLETTASSAQTNLQLLGKREHELSAALGVSEVGEAIQNIKVKNRLGFSDRVSIWNDGSVTDEQGKVLGNVYDEL